MSLTVRSEPHQQQTYADNVKMVAQQKRNKLRETITVAEASGEAQSVADLVGSVEAQENTSRQRRNIENPPSLSRRWVVFPDELESGQYLDKEEKLQKAMDPTSVYVRTHTVAVERGIGDKILGVKYVSKGNFELRDGGVLGAAVDGKSPGSAKIALPGKCYTQAAGSGLILDKLMAGKERLNGDDFGLEDDDEMHCAIGVKQVTNLLNMARGNDENLNLLEQMALKTGTPTTLLGITWHVTNRLPLDTNGDRMCPLWTKNNIVMGVWQDTVGEMWNDTSAKNTPYAHVGAFVDVVRAEDDGVHVFLCDES